MTEFKEDQFWKDEISEHLEVAQNSFDLLQQDFLKILSLCEQAILNNKKIIFAGNGGSAADSQHLATELTIRYSKNRIPIRSVALTTDSSALTAAGNDLGFEKIFSRQIEALGEKGDIFIAISTSGNSANILEALKQAQSQSLTCIGFTGHQGGKMLPLCDAHLIIPSQTTARIQEMHITFGQMLCGALEKKLGLI